MHDVMITAQCWLNACSNGTTRSSSLHRWRRQIVGVSLPKQVADFMQCSVEPVTSRQIVPRFCHIHDRCGASGQTNNATCTCRDGRIQRSHIASDDCISTGRRLYKIDAGNLTVIGEDFASTVLLRVGDRVAEGVALRIGAVITFEVVLSEGDARTPSIRARPKWHRQKMILNFNDTMSGLIVSPRKLECNKLRIDGRSDY